MDNHQFYQFAETARRLHHAMVQSDPSAVPSIMAADAVCHALSIEKAIERHQPESTLEPTPAIPCTLMRLDPRDPDTWPEDDQQCRYALYDPLLAADGVPGWVFGEGTWDDPSKCWCGMGGDASGLVNALMLRSAYWCPFRTMSESEFRAWMRSIRP